MIGRYSTFQKRYTLFLPWTSYHRRTRGVQRIRLTPKRSLLLVLILTSLWWISYHILFIFYRNSEIVDLEVIVVKKADRREVGTYTPPQHLHQHMFMPAPPRSETKLPISTKDKLILNDIEMFPTLVIPGLGKGGEPAGLPQYLETESKLRFADNSFDSVLSKRISLNRELKDYRGKLCTAKENLYPRTLLHMSIIICFHNEDITALLRTVHSIINHTPSHLISSIILVDDASTLGSLGDTLNSYIILLKKQWENKILMLRNRKREGLVRSRLKGAEQALGDVLTFLDSHCEVTQGWAEPLLTRIHENRKNVVCPVIEIIDAHDFSYKNTETKDIKQVGGFTWDLFFDWKAMSSEDEKNRLDETYPLKSPTMAGGLFSMDRSYFYELGTYDDQMDIWGGENLELSFRIWMCGGNLEIIPCSRVGHIFRNTDSPYSFPDGVGKTLNKNFNRLAEVWMDEYKEKYYKRRTETDRQADIGDLTARKELRNRLKCNSFDWFVKNIVPGMLGADPNPPASGEVRNMETNQCIDSMGETAQKSKLYFYPCNGGTNQQFVYTKKDEITFDDQKCLDYSLSNDENLVELWNCHGLGGNQVWKHDQRSGLIQHEVSGNCLAIQNNGYLTVQTCDQSNQSQRWKFSHYRKGNGNEFEEDVRKAIIDDSNDDDGRW